MTLDTHGRLSDADVRRRFEAVCNNATLALFVMDEQQQCVYMNPAAEKLTGYTLGEVHGRALHDVVHHTRPDGRPYPIEECPIDRVFPENNQEQGEEIFVDKSGRFYPVAFTASPIREDGRTVGTIIEVRGLENERLERERRERAEAERERLLEAERGAREESETIRRLGQLFAAELDLQRIVQAVTDAATELTHARFGSFFYNVIDAAGGSYTLYTLSGVPRSAFAHFPMPRATDLFGPTFRGEGTVRIANVRHDDRYGRNSPYYGMPEGHLPVVSYLAVPVISRSGEVLGGLFFGHDDEGVFTERHERIVEGLAAQAAIAIDNARLFISVQRERTRAEEVAADNERLLREAEEANRAKDEFLATVSHELRTPLTAILGWVRLLSSGSLDADDERRAVETIERNAEAQAQIIDDILDISRILSGRFRIESRPVDVAQVVAQALESLQPTATARSVTMNRMIDSGAGFVYGDPDRIQQIVWNLGSNAVKFTPKGGRVSVGVRRVGSAVEIVVADNGKGIAPELVPHVFDRFRQADSSSTRREGGLGLGLAIVKQLVEIHGGTVSVESAGEGRGASFSVVLPVAATSTDAGMSTSLDDSIDCSAGAAAERPLGKGLTSLRGMKVLVVDDEEDTREMLAKVLTMSEAEVTLASSALDALGVLEHLAPSVLLSDIGMPDVDGIELIRRVRAMERETGRRPTPAVALSAYARSEDRLRALAAGFQMHLPKPVEPAELTAVMRSLDEWRSL